MLLQQELEVQCLGKPELLMTGATTFIRINEKLKFGSNYKILLEYFFIKY